MQMYKVANENGVEIDGVHFPFNEVVELDAEAMSVEDLIAEGSLVETTDEEAMTITDEVEDIVPSEEDEDTSEEDEEIVPEIPETGTFYNGVKIVGEVQDVSVEGVAHKKFSTVSGEGYTITEEEFKASTTVEQ